MGFLDNEGHEAEGGLKGVNSGIVPLEQSLKADIGSCPDHRITPQPPFPVCTGRNESTVHFGKHGQF